MFLRLQYCLLSLSRPPTASLSPPPSASFFFTRSADDLSFLPFACLRNLSSPHHACGAAWLPRPAPPFPFPFFYLSLSFVYPFRPIRPRRMHSTHRSRHPEELPIQRGPSRSPPSMPLSAWFSRFPFMDFLTTPTLNLQTSCPSPAPFLSWIRILPLIVSASLCLSLFFLVACPFSKDPRPPF